MRLDIVAGAYAVTIDSYLHRSPRSVPRGDALTSRSQSTTFASACSLPMERRGAHASSRSAAHAPGDRSSMLRAGCSCTRMSTSARYSKGLIRRAPHVATSAWRPAMLSPRSTSCTKKQFLRRRATRRSALSEPSLSSGTRSSARGRRAPPTSAAFTGRVVSEIPTFNTEVNRLGLQSAGLQRATRACHS